MRRIFLLWSIGAIHSIGLFAQPMPAANPVTPSLEDFSAHKTFPPDMRVPILAALSHYPELSNMHIIFREVKARTPFTTRPDFISMFRRKDHRTYIIRISKKTIDTLSQLLYYHLSVAQQTGVIGHELGHVVDFNHKNFFQSLHNALGHLSQRFLDRMEFKTDKICIQHGLGPDLLSYREYLFSKMHIEKYWRGVDHVFKPDTKYERYMSPSTIEKYMRR